MADVTFERMRKDYVDGELEPAIADGGLKVKKVANRGSAHVSVHPCDPSARAQRAALGEGGLMSRLARLSARGPLHLLHLLLAAIGLLWLVPTLALILVMVAAPAGYAFACRRFPGPLAGSVK